MERRGAYALMGSDPRGCRGRRPVHRVRDRARRLTKPAAIRWPARCSKPSTARMGHHESQTKSDRTSLGPATAPLSARLVLRAARLRPVRLRHRDPGRRQEGAQTERRRAYGPPVSSNELAERRPPSTRSLGALTCRRHPDALAARPCGPSEPRVAVIARNPVYRGHVQYKGVTYMTVEPTHDRNQLAEGERPARKRSRQEP